MIVLSENFGVENIIYPDIPPKITDSSNAILAQFLYFFATFMSLAFFDLLKYVNAIKSNTIITATVMNT